MCRNDKNNTIIFNIHPQFCPDNNFKSNMSVLSSSFRLLFSFQVKNVNCTWKFQSKGTENNHTEIEISESNHKYVIDNYRKNNETDIWTNDFQILKPDINDTGIYVCVLKNAHGTTFKMIDVTVKSKLEVKN